MSGRDRILTRPEFGGGRWESARIQGDVGLKFAEGLAVFMLRLDLNLPRMTENILIPLPGFTLPEDFPWRVRFVDAVEAQLKRLRVAGGFSPPRFFGYYFMQDEPVAVSGHWTVTLDESAPLRALPGALDQFTLGQYAITSPERERAPDYLLVHDRRDGACWLWRFAFGLRFVEATDPQLSRSAFPDE